jgi:DNA polymerase I
MQIKKYIFLDAEYNNTREARFNVVCFAVVSDKGTQKFWLYNGHQHEAFRNHLEQFITEGYIFIAYSVEAEASALISVGVDPLRMKWIDLFLEYRMLSNHNNAISKGEQLMHGKVVKLPNHGFNKGSESLAAALFKLCGIKIDTEHKNIMRDLIISAPKEFSLEEQTAITDYCVSDTEHLLTLLEALKVQYAKYIPREHRATLRDEAHWRAEYAVRTAMMVRHGYPVNVEWIKNLTENIPGLIRECAEDINSQFDIKPFKWNKKELRYSMNQKVVKEWIKTCPHYHKWETTDSGDLSLAADSWKKFYNYSHDYPEGNFGAQMLRYANFTQQLKGFTPSKGKASFWDYVGSDGMVRPYMNIYKAQSSRSQPSSTSFLFLKTGWMRSLCVPPKGYAIGAIDYSSQEFLIGGLLSKDRKMIDAYASGDVYLAYGKQLRLIPKDGTKQSHGKERDAQKPVILAWQYWSTGYGLSDTLNEISGTRNWDNENAQVLLDQLDETYLTFSEFRKNQMDRYSSAKYVRLLDGYYMFGSNPNFRSVGNCPTQGAGACIMRKAVQLAQDAGLNVIMTLHDALYIMFDSTDLFAMATLKKCMYDAFIFYFNERDKEYAKLIRMDGKIWSQDFNLDNGVIDIALDFTVDSQKIFVDGRAKKQYAQFNRFFKHKLDHELL